MAVAMGAVAVEKHFTLSRSDSGLDDSFALDPTLFTHMSATIRRIDAILSLDPQGGRKKVLGEFAAEYGQERVHSILGTGIKTLAPSEADSYATTRRTLHAVADLEPGTEVSRENVAALRSERNLKAGIEPRYLDEIAGARITERVSAGDGIQWHHLLAL
jgi:N-acetylneuraminate synthase